MQEICSKDKCSGCTACMNMCAQGAIAMQSDACGFSFPVINQEACVDCGLCTQTCPANNPVELEMPQACYAMTIKKEKKLLTCASGGAATVISQYVLQQGGVVYGCSGKNPRNVHHVRVEEMDGLEELKKSKYVQSELGLTFQGIKADLKGNRMVLFVGTPCQVAGLKGFLHRDYPNLLTIDLACHGVPSQKMLNDNLKHYCLDDKEICVAFRRKHQDGKYYAIEYGLEIRSGQTYTFKPYNKDYYMFGFLKGLILRESCYICPYAQNHRAGDLTLCDFWGLQPDAGFEVGKGVSAVFVNTDRGNAFFEKIKDKVTWKQREVAEATRWNGCLNTPGEKPKNYERFKGIYATVSFKKAMRRAYYQAYLYDYYIKYKNQLKDFLYHYKLLKH